MKLLPPSSPMNTYAYNNIIGQGHPLYKKIDYQKTREDEEKDHASYAAIIEYSQMQEKLLVNLRHQLEEIRGVDDREMQQIITPSFANQKPSHTVSPSVTAFKNAAIAARKLPSQNSRNKHKQISPTILNPKRDYPRPWAVDKMIEQTSENASEHSHFTPFDSTPFRTQAKNPQKQYYSSGMERHQPIPIAFHEGFNAQPLCQNCQIPINNEHMHRDEYFFANQGNKYEQYVNSQQIAPKTKGARPPSGQILNSRPWNNNYYVTDDILNEHSNSQYNSVVFPDPQAKQHPYLAKILEKTIPNTYNDPRSTKVPNETSRIQKQLKTISGSQNANGAAAVKVYNLLEVKEDEREMYPSWNRRVQNNRPSVSLNVHVEESVRDGQKTQMMTRISSSISIGMGDRQDEMTLLPPRCILSSLSPVWSQTSAQNRDQPKGQQRRSKDTVPLPDDSESDDGKRNNSYATVNAKLGKEKSESMGPGRAVTYQVFTQSNKVLSEWDGAEPDLENKTDEPGKNIEKDFKGEELRHSRNAQSSGDESYGSMKVIRDSNEDFVKRIYDDFDSYEDFEAAVEREAVTASAVKNKSKGDAKPTVIKAQPESPVVKAKDSRSLVRNQRLSFYKKKDGVSDSISKKESRLKLPLVKKSISLTSQTNAQSTKSQANKWPPLVIEKMFPRVDKALEEARGLSNFVDNLHKTMESPPDLEKLIDNKQLRWVGSKLTRFPTWFREVDPISKLGEHLTIDKVFQIDIKPGTWKSSPLEEFITDSVGVFCGSKTSLDGKNDRRMSASVARKTTSQLIYEVKNEAMEESGQSDTEPIRPIDSALIAEAPTKQVRTLTGTFPQEKDINSTKDEDPRYRVTELARKATTVPTYRDVNANIETRKMETLNKVIELGQAYAKTKKNKGLGAKSIAKIVLPNPKLKETPEETTILERATADYTKLDRRQLKRLMDNPGSYTHFDGTIDTERLLKETKESNYNKLLSLEKRMKEKKQSAIKTSTSSKSRKTIKNATSHYQK